MLENYNQQKEDKQIQQLLSTSKINAPENLKYRIMRQIEAENALVPKEEKPIKISGNVLKEMGIHFGIMYAVLAVMIAGVYFFLGDEYLLSPQFIGSIILVASVFCLLWLISRLDSYLREKKRIH
jgi:hypothetical protein